MNEPQWLSELEGKVYAKLFFSLTYLTKMEGSLLRDLYFLLILK